MQTFVAVSNQTADAVGNYVSPTVTVGQPEQELEHFVSTKTFTPSVTLALQQEITDIRNEVTLYGTLKGVPANQQANVRNQMYLTSETLRLLPKAKGAPKFSDADNQTIANYKSYLDKSTKFIPTWVKVAVALALGLGTMVGWKRIVVTVGEKIGKTHMTYAQGASAELITMATILGADHLGVPVSTTHILNSGVAGTMAANRSGLQLSTVRDIALAWIFTLPAAALLSGGLFFLFNKMAGQ
jgi:PiT family inorganic phosphate transporter